MRRVRHGHPWIRDTSTCDNFHYPSSLIDVTYTYFLIFLNAPFSHIIFILHSHKLSRYAYHLIYIFFSTFPSSTVPYLPYIYRISTIYLPFNFSIYFSPPSPRSSPGPQVQVDTLMPLRLPGLPRRQSSTSFWSPLSRAVGARTPLLSESAPVFPEVGDQP